MTRKTGPEKISLRLVVVDDSCKGASAFFFFNLLCVQDGDPFRELDVLLLLPLQVGVAANLGGLLLQEGKQGGAGGVEEP